jgi:MOSC domain-containing protein YiiM
MSILEQGLDEVRESPKDTGTVELIARRPELDERELLEEAELDPAEGLVGDRWRKAGGRPKTDRQLTLMNARAAALVAGAPDRWALAGDQLYVDFDLSDENVPPGTRLRVGSALIEITAEPHLGCGKFSRRFGVDALKLVNSEVGRALHLRGVNARVITGGAVRKGDRISRA